jgi:hypothetical protein
MCGDGSMVIRAAATGQLSIQVPLQRADTRARMETPVGGNRRRERIVFETDRQLIVGNLILPSEGYQSRFSDAINRREVGFLPLIDVEITPLAGGEALRRDFIVLGKAHIRLAYPLDESAERQG